MSTQHEEIKYSYKGVPTLRKFARDDSPIRSVIGPFGPVSGDTEFLSGNGWKRIDQYEPGDTIAQWYPDGTLERVIPQDYIITSADKLLHIRTKHTVSMVVSPNHRIPLYSHNNNLQVYTGEYISQHKGRHRVPINYSIGYDDFPITDADLRLRVAINADGSFSKRGNPLKATFGLRKKRKKKRLEWLLNENNIEYAVSPAKNRPTEHNYRFIASAREKTFTGWWWFISERQLKIVLDEVKYWDGLYESEDTRFFTTSKPCADYIQYAVHAVGGRASIKCDNASKKGWNDCYIVHIAKPGSVKANAYVREHTKINWVNNPSGKQYCFKTGSSFFLARHNGCVFVTGNSGKSTAVGPVEIVRRAMMQQPHPDGIRRTRWMVVRNTYKQLEDTTIKTFHEWLPPNYFGEYQKSDHNYTINAFPNCKIEVNFRALDRPEHVRNVLSYELTGAFINEAREIPWALIGPLFGRTGRYPSKRTKVPCTWRGVFMDSNAPPMNHWMYRIHEKKKLTEHEQKMLKYWATYNQPSGLSPQAENRDNLPDDYYEMMASMMTEDQIKVYIENQYGYLKHGKPVYDTWRDRVHGRKDLFPQDAAFTILRGWDFGLTPACVLSYVAPNGQLRMFKEFTTERAGIGDFAKHVLSWCTQHLGDFKFDDWGDPSGDAGRGTSDKSGFEVLEGLGVMIQGASNDMMIRLESTRYGLNTLIDGEAALVVDMQECTVVAEGFQGGYEYRRIITSASERYSEAEPNKNNYSHPHDAVQYITQRVFGDMVLYNQGSVDGMKNMPQRQMINDEPDFDLYGALDPDYEMPQEQIT